MAITNSSPNRAFKLGVVSSYVPKKCGIATFCHNLLLNIKPSPYGNLFVVAAEDQENFNYATEVKAKVDTASLASYKTAAKRLESFSPDVVLVQHEYGLYGGQWTDFSIQGVKHHDPSGSYLLELLRTLNVPIITTLHTVLEGLDPVRMKVLGEVIDLSTNIVVMSETSKKVITRQFPGSKPKVVVIPHGVMTRRKVESKAVTLKRLVLPRGRFYLVVTGLLGPNKNIESIIAALPAIIKHHPQVRLLVVGQTHPQILKTADDSYRQMLKKLALDLGVANYVKFINKYLQPDELLDYLEITDIYLTIHNDPQQAASGTLANAIGNGLVVISTPYPYAKELLTRRRGILVPFNDSPAIGRAVNRLINNRQLYREIKHNARSNAQPMAWPDVAAAYWQLMKAAQD